jgi:hypothetical protein
MEEGRDGKKEKYKGRTGKKKGWKEEASLTER